MTVKEEMLTIREVQDILKCGKTTAYSLVSQRLIPATRIGRSLRIRKSDLERFIEDNRY